MPTDSYINVPTNSTGTKVRTQTRVVGSDTVHEHFMMAVPHASFQAGQVNIAASATQIASTPLTGRKAIAIKNMSTSTTTIFVGGSGVTVTTGYQLSPGEGVTIDIDDTVSVYAISLSGTQRVSYLEIA